MSLQLLTMHEEVWKDGCGNAICQTSHKKCFYDTIPTGLSRVDILFIGEGPGQSEDMIGKPFVGPAGRLLRDALAEALPGVDIGLSNLVCCRPVDEKSNRAPEEEEIKLCFGRLNQLVNILQPKITVALGRVPEAASKDWTWKGRFRSLRHPSHILRLAGNDYLESRDYKKYVEALKALAEELEKMQ